MSIRISTVLGYWGDQEARRLELVSAMTTLGIQSTRSHLEYASFKSSESKSVVTVNKRWLVRTLLRVVCPMGTSMGITYEPC